MGTTIIASATWLVLVTSSWAETPAAQSQVRSDTPGSEAPPTPASLAQVADELARLKAEVRQLKNEHRALRVAVLEDDLKRAATARITIDTQRTLVDQELEQIDEQLRQPLDNESYVNLSTARADLVESRAAQLESQHRKASQREAEIGKQLEAERKELDRVRQ